MPSKPNGTSKLLPPENESKKKKNAAATTAKVTSSERPQSSFAHLVVPAMVALLAFAVGVAVPPFLMWMRLIEPTSSRMFERRILTGNNNDVVGRSDQNTPRYPCTSTRLEEYLHAEFVPGFHIICLEVAADNLNVQTYQGGLRSKQIDLTFAMPVAWDALKTELMQALNVRSADDMHQPWAFFAPHGQRVLDETEDEDQVGSLSLSLASQLGMVLLYQGGQFLWPGVRVGFQRHVDLYSIMPVGSPDFPNKNTTVTLETLSLKPLVLSVQGFLTPEECQYIQDKATPTMKYSDVVLMDHDKGRPASDFRTSQTTFLSATSDDTLTDIDYRTASLVRIARNHQEPVQLLRYGKTEKYSAHHDFFSPELYQSDASTLRLIQNGRRNRMVTVFWYLSDVAEGGHTVFPRSDGARESSPEDCESGLKVRPETGKVIIFYSMTFDGSTDPNSLHGACPVKEGIKWAANKWVWNEPMRYVRP
jgi:prolyl 4-hydroxylase